MPLEVSCEVSSMVPPNPVIFTTAQALLAVLDETGHIGDSKHPNKYELEAQRALLRHAIRHRAVFRLKDDHWGRTGWALLDLFERGEGHMELDGITYKFESVKKTEWKEGDDALAMQGGFTYSTEDGRLLFKAMTWVS